MRVGVIAICTNDANADRAHWQHISEHLQAQRHSPWWLTEAPGAASCTEPEVWTRFVAPAPQVLGASLAACGEVRMYADRGITRQMLATCRQVLLRGHQHQHLRGVCVLLLNREVFWLESAKDLNLLMELTKAGWAARPPDAAGAP